MSNYANLMKSPVPQTERLSANQVQNNSGGFVHALDKWKRLDRFLILGSDSNTYYQSAKAITRENAACVVECWNEDPDRTSDRVADISVAGRAPKNSPAIFALALGAVSDRADVRAYALSKVHMVCRTASHLFEFVDTARALGRGWGRAMKRTVAEWYTRRTPDDVAFQAVKYRERNGYSHKRLLQTSHPMAAESDAARVALYRWIVGKEPNFAPMPNIVRAHLQAMSLPESEIVSLCGLITEARLPWEALPTWANTKPDVWRAMIPHLGLTALIRNLGNISKSGAIVPLGDTEREIVARLSDENAMRKARIHPFAILQAIAVYASGHSVKGTGSWTPSQPVLSALNQSFYPAFANVEPTGKRYLIGLDVSGSMDTTMNGSVLTCRVAGAALAMVTMATEPSTHVVGFTAGNGRTACTPLPITREMRLADVVHATSGLRFGTTDCALPISYAIANGIQTDVFVIITDNETYAGNEHPVAALKRYRKMTGIDAKMIVIGMTSTGFSIADPNDPGMLDMVGMDSSGPAVMSEFVRG